jgi:hypothetical protein
VIPSDDLPDPDPRWLQAFYPDDASDEEVANLTADVALSVGVRGLEKLWAMPSSAKNARVERDVICVPRSDAAAGSSGPSAASRPSSARALPHASWMAAEVASGEKQWPTCQRSRKPAGERARVQVIPHHRVHVIPQF